jgi:hypothetical protein
MRVAVRIAIAGIGPTTVGAVSVKAFSKATALEMTVAETCVPPGDPVAFEAGVVHRDPVAVRRDPIASESGVIHCDPEASETAVACRDTEASETGAVTSTAKTADMAPTAKTTAAPAAPCERDCAGHRRRYAERNGCTCCNQLLTHFSELLMFHFIWIASARPLCSYCWDWFTIAPIWKDRQNQEVVQGSGRARPYA